MKTSLRFAAAVALLASCALGQIAIPPHAAVYNGFSRGYNFTASTNFIISQLDLPPEAFQAGDTASYMVRVNGVEILRSVGNAGAISTNILVNTGDVVDVIGNWSPAITNNFTAHNSYGNGPFATTILGVAHTLTRTGWQWDISDPAYLSGAYLAPTAGQLGRVLLWATPQAGLFPGFSAAPTSGAAPLGVQFTDQTFTSDPGGVLSWSWDVDGNGTTDYTVQNPFHTYATEGTYNVALTVVDGTHGPQSITRNGYIRVDHVEASFTFQLTGATRVSFSDTSIGNPTSWAWDFDNSGTVDSNARNPVHVYPTQGSYECKLVVADAISTDDVTVTIGVSILPISAFQSTYTNAAQTRGLWFQTPVAFSISSLKVPDESAHGLQNVAVYNLGQAPPAYTATMPGVPLFFRGGLPSNVPIPCAISFAPGDYVGIMGACGDASTMRSSYGAGPFASSIFGQPVTLTRFITQTNIVTNNGVCPVSSAAGSIGRIEVGISAATALPYGTGTPSSPGGVAPVLGTTALPRLGNTAELSVTLAAADGGAIGFLIVGVGRVSIPLSFGTILTIPNLTFTMNGGVPLNVGSNPFQIAVPPDPWLNGAGPVDWQNLNLVPGSPNGLSLSNGQEWFVAF